MSKDVAFDTYCQIAFQRDHANWHSHQQQKRGQASPHPDLPWRWVCFLSCCQSDRQNKRQLKIAFICIFSSLAYRGVEAVKSVSTEELKLWRLQKPCKMCDPGRAALAPYRGLPPLQSVNNYPCPSTFLSVQWKAFSPACGTQMARSKQ